MRIEDLITRSPVTVPRGTMLSEAADRMAETNVGSVVVVQDDREPVGIVTDRDLALHLAGGVRETTVDDIMTTFPVSVDRSTDVEACIERMDTHGVRRILVLDQDEELLGVVSLDDIVIHLSNVLARAGSLIRSEVVGRR